MQNAFSEKLYPLGFNLFLMLVVDFLHEFELGVWKAVFTHLLHMLECLDKSKIHELDRRYVFPKYAALFNLYPLLRYCQIPTFGRDMIHSPGMHRR